MSRILFLYFQLFFILASAGLIIFITCTTPGLQLDIAFAARYLPGKLTLDKIEGSLFSAFSLHHITYENTDEKIDIESIHFAWSPRFLFKNSLHIKNVTIGNTHLYTNKNKTKPEPFDFKQLHWLKYIYIEQATLSSLIVETNHQIMFQGSSFYISQHNQDNIISAKILGGDLHGKFSYALTPQLNWTVALSAKHIADTDIQMTGSMAENWDFNWTISIPNLSTLLPNSKGSLLSTGSISGNRLTPEIKANMAVKHLIIDKNKIDKLNAKMTLSLLPHAVSTLTLNAFGVHIDDYAIHQSTLTANGNIAFINHALTSNIKLNIDQHYVLSANLTLPDFLNAEQKIESNMLVNLTYLDVLTDFIPYILHPQGHLLGDIHLSGLLQKPSIDAKFHLENGSVFLPPLGVTLTKIDLQSYLDLKQQLRISGSMESDKGSAKIEGHTDLSNPHFTASLSLQGNNLRVLNLDHFKMTASPDIKLALLDTGLQIRGTLLIPDADITPNTFSDTLTLPEEVVFVGEPKLNTSQDFSHLSLALNIILGENIRFHYQDLQAQLGGNIRISQNPGSPAIGSGELYTLKGTYHAYGKLLDIQQGRLIYTGNTLTNPGLNIRAGREIKTVSVNSGTSDFSSTQALAPIYTGRSTVNVGVQIQGTVRNPSVSLFSIPTMNQGDILSYLLFGYPQSQAGGSNQIGTLLSATSIMNLGGKETSHLTKLIQNIQDNLGLNELTVGSAEVFDPTKGTAVATTSFMVGKQLAPNLYLHYSIGLFNPISILNLRYQITKRWAIQSETSTIDSGADLQYGFERN